MLPTVAHVLELDVMRRGLPQVVAGAAQLERPVRWVHVSELPDVAEMLQGGELVLTTGIALPEDRAALAMYVRQLDEVGVAGLVIEYGRRYVDALPRALVRAAEQRGLPLIVLRRELPFVAVTEAVHALVVNAQLERLRVSEAVHQVFTELAATAIRGSGLSALVGALDDEGVGMLVALGSQQDEHTALETFAASLRRLLTEGARETQPVIAVGSSVGSVRDARRTLLEAAQVADAALHDSPGARSAAYYRLPDVRLRGLLHLLRDDERLQTYVERELGSLLAYDAERGGELVQMLRIYLEQGRNKSAAADAAHLSRPSFYDRLHKVERILGVDLDQVESCLSLHVALLALDAVRR